MQRNGHGIPVNIPKGYKPNRMKKTVKTQATHDSVIVPNPYTNYAVLTRTVDGLEQTAIGPIGTKEYKRAIRDGYKEVETFKSNKQEDN